MQHLENRTPQSSHDGMVLARESRARQQAWIEGSHVHVGVLASKRCTRRDREKLCPGVAAHTSRPGRFSVRIRSSK